MYKLQGPSYLSAARCEHRLSPLGNGESCESRRGVTFPAAPQRLSDVATVYRRGVLVHDSVLIDSSRNCRSVQGCSNSPSSISVLYPSHLPSSLERKGSFTSPSQCSPSPFLTTARPGKATKANWRRYSRCGRYEKQGGLRTARRQPVDAQRP